MFKKTIFLLFSVTLLTACMQQPVLYRENFFTVRKGNINPICKVLVKNFPDYSCLDYFNKTYQFKDSLEMVKIKLNKEQLDLIYTTEDQNGNLFRQYENMVEGLHHIKAAKMKSQTIRIGKKSDSLQ